MLKNYIAAKLRGLIMKKTSGKVNPGVTNMVLKEELEKL